ncbi:MAG: histidine utilization repressor, partial [Alphaproteobacteria bacterium]|nr:histidine utilization repressor [Alphaproteobacteria bacterium]
MRQSAVPLYRRVRDYITDKLDSGVWEIEARIPSENQLVRQLGASRMTINRALRELTAEGRLERHQGIGTFVADPRPRLELLEIRNIAEEIRERGHAHTSVVHRVGKERATLEIAEALEIAEGDDVFHSLLVHNENDVPVQVEDRYVNPAAAPDYLSIDFTCTTPNEYLMRAAPLRDVEHTREAILPDRRLQKLLNVGPQEPCLLLHRQTWSRDIVASHAWLTHPGSRYRMHARFTHARLRIAGVGGTRHPSRAA